MAASSPLPFLLFLLTISISISSSIAFGGDRKVGGRTEVVNVESNREVQDLGRFCVEEYNRRLRSGEYPLLSFSRVVAAEKQVVAGIKYYLRIAARDPSAGRRRLFDAVVVVKPWAGESRDLVSFTPSTNYWK